MIVSDTIGPVALTGLAVVAGLAIDAIGVPNEMVPSGSTVTAGGAAVSLVWICRAFFQRLDRVISIVETGADKWNSHVQRTEQLHQIALAQLRGDGVPRDELEDVTPIESRVFRRKH